MARPKTYIARSKTLSDGRTQSYYARFTDQHGHRQEVPIGYDLTDAQVETKLADIKYEVEHRTWKPPNAPASPPSTNPTFHEFASDWRAELGTGEYAPRTLSHADWALSHLLPYFARKRMRDIDTDAVDDYRRKLMAKGRLSATSVNKTIEVLARIMETGSRYYRPNANPAAGKSRKAKVGRRDPVGSWLDYEQVVALLDAAHLLDTVPHAELVARYGEAVPYVRFRNLGRRPQLATLFLGALRVTESCNLECRHVNFSRGTLRVDDAKTAAGYRMAPMHRMLYAHMREWRERHPNWRPEAPLFPHARGGHRDKDNTRENVLKPAAQLAALLLEDRGQNPLPRNARTHDGRRTALNWWAEAGYDQSKAMAWCGHRTARLAYEVYRQALTRGDDQRVKDAMVEVPEPERALLRVVRAA
jgi:integrase